MNVTALSIPAVRLITPGVSRDARGFFSETFNARDLAKAGIVGTFVQDNHSLSVARGVVRGLHFQCPPRAQDKLVRVTRGAIFDVAVDLRSGSATYGKHVCATLSAENWSQLWIPEGFAHGFCTLEPHTEVVYKVTDYYAQDCERGLRWNDPALGIDWPISPRDALLSEKDAQNPMLSEMTPVFRY